MKIQQTLATLVVLTPIFCAVPYSACASDEENLTAMVQDFLVNADVEDAHARFWADDLIYTSSSGLRFGKPEIMAAFDKSDNSDNPGDDESEIAYSGVEMDVRLYGDTAVVAFKLVGTPVNSTADALYYYNTGTFLRRNGEWRVVAWQATKIPSAP